MVEGKSSLAVVQMKEMDTVPVVVAELVQSAQARRQTTQGIGCLVWKILVVWLCLAGEWEEGQTLMKRRSSPGPRYPPPVFAMDL